MVDLTKFLPKESPVVSAIYAAYKKRGDTEPTRGYLGASIIGHSCSRYLWYTFRACVKPDFPGRMHRLFDTGDREESRMARDLRDIGCEVHEHEPPPSPAYIDDISAAPKQFEITDIGGHFSGHMDGCALGIPGAEKTWHVTEYKTHNNKSFTKLKKEGVQKSKPVHYAQMQVYMHKTGMKRALYLAVNKDTDELYAERVRYDPRLGEALMVKARQIIFATEPPERITNRQDWWECRFCDAHKLCWGSEESALPIPSVNCRQCCHSTPKLDGKARWVCEKYHRGLSKLDQTTTCLDHLILPGLINFAEPTGHSNGNIEFTNADGTKWQAGCGEGCFSSGELRTLPASTLTNQAIEGAKELFGAEASGFSADDILSRYPAGDCHLAWEGPVNNLAAAWNDFFKESMSLSKEISRCDNLDYKAVEFDGGRVAIVWAKGRKAEIRCGKE